MDSFQLYFLDYSYLGKRVCEDMVPLSFLEINSLVSGIGFRNTFN